MAYLTANDKDSLKYEDGSLAQYIIDLSNYPSLDDTDFYELVVVAAHTVKAREELTESLKP